MNNNDLEEMGAEWDDYYNGYVFKGHNFVFKFHEENSLYVREGDNYHGLPFTVRARWQVRNLVDILIGPIL